MAGDVGRDTGGPSGQGQGLWKLEVARQVLAEDYGPRLDWVAVAKALDHDRFNIPDQVHRFDQCRRVLAFWFSLDVVGSRGVCATWSRLWSRSLGRARFVGLSLVLVYTGAGSDGRLHIGHARGICRRLPRHPSRIF